MMIFKVRNAVGQQGSRGISYTFLDYTPRFSGGGGINLLVRMGRITPTDYT